MTESDNAERVVGIDPADLQSIFNQHRREYNAWCIVAVSVERILAEVTQGLCIPARITARAKETGSLLGKVERKQRLDIATYRDLAGARVVVPFVADVQPIVEALKRDQRLRVIHIDDKRPSPSSLEYRGVHLDVVLVSRPPEAATIERDLICEVQVKTSAQSLWAELSHIVTYKKTVPESVERRVRRLLALCEIIDDEIEGAMSVVKGEADLSGLIAELLERLYYGLTGRAYDRRSSVAMIEKLIDAVPPSQVAGYTEVLTKFVIDNRDVLQLILGDNPEARGIPLLTRPESLLIFERLTNARLTFPVFWSEHFVPSTLDRLQKVWGDPSAA